MIPTPGHTLDSVSLQVLTEQGVVVVAGDTFEKQEDLKDESIWVDAGSQDSSKQTESRKRILAIADFVVPGHGAMFRVDKNLVISNDK